MSTDTPLAPCGAPLLSWDGVAGLRPCDVGARAAQSDATVVELVGALASMPPRFMGCALNYLAFQAQGVPMDRRLNGHG